MRKYMKDIRREVGSIKKIFETIVFSRKNIIERIYNLVKNVVLIVSFIIIATSVIVLSVFIIKEYKKSYLIIDNFELNENLKKQGFSDSYIKNGLRDRINDLTQNDSLADPCNIDINKERWVFEKRINFEIQKESISSKEIVEIISYITGKEDYFVNGEANLFGDSIELCVRMKKGYSLGEYKIKRFRCHIDDIDKVLNQSAMLILKYLDPVSLAGHYYLSDKEVALDVIKHGLSHPPRDDDCKLYVIKGIILRKEGKDFEALRMFEKAKALCSEYSMAYFYLGHYNLKNGNKKEAEKNYLKAIKLKNRWAYLPLGNIYIDKKDINNAMKLFKKGMELNEYNYRCLTRYGECLRLKGEFKEALKTFERVDEICYQYATCYASWGLTLYSLGKYEEGIKKMEIAVKNDLQYKDDEKYELAIRMLEYASKIDRDNKSIYEYWGISLFELGEYEDAIPKFKKSISMDSSIIDNYLNLACCYSEIGKYIKSHNILEKAEKIDSSMVLLYLNWGSNYGKMGNHKEALKKYKKAVKIDSTKKDLYMENIGSFVNKGLYDDAIEWLNEALLIDKDDVEIYLSIGYCYDKKGEYEKAKMKYKNAIEIDKNNIIGNVNYGIMLIKTGEIEKGKEVLIRSKELDLERDMLENINNILGKIKN